MWATLLLVCILLVAFVPDTRGDGTGGGVPPNVNDSTGAPAYTGDGTDAVSTYGTEPSGSDLEKFAALFTILMI
jgi:hypothetical protein